MNMLALIEIDSHKGHGLAAYTVAVRSVTGGTGKFDQILADNCGTLADNQGFFCSAEGRQSARRHIGPFTTAGAHHGEGAIAVQGNFAARLRGAKRQPGQTKNNSGQDKEGNGQNGYLKKGHSEDTSVVLQQ